MRAKAQLAAQQEADLVQRFARGYRSRLAGIIENLNHAIAANSADLKQHETMRCCLEAVDLVLASHEQFAKLMSTIAGLDTI